MLNSMIYFDATATYPISEYKYIYCLKVKMEKVIWTAWALVRYSNVVKSLLGNIQVKASILIESYNSDFSIPKYVGISIFTNTYLH